MPLLERRGHRVLTPDLAGVGDDTPAADISLARWTDQISALVSEQSKRVILAGHSRSGIVLSMVAERVPERIAYLVYMSGSLLPDGGSIASHGPQQDPSTPSPLTVDSSGMATFDQAAARYVFLNETAPEWADRALADLVAEPLWMFSERIHITSSRFGSIPRAYIETIHDHAVPIEVQRDWQAQLPCDPVFTLETDHSPFYTDPVALADALHAVTDRASS